MKNWNTPGVTELDVKATATTYCAPGGNRPGFPGGNRPGFPGGGWPGYPGGGNTEIERCVPGEKENVGS